MPEQQPTLMFQGYRYPHLNRLWARLAGEPSLPELDQWLVRQLRGQRQFGKQDRLFYADALFAAMRYLATCQALEELYQEGNSDLVSGSLACSTLWERVRQMPAPALWYWVKCVTGAGGDSPRELADTAERTDLWRRCREDWQDNPEAGLLLQGLMPGWLPWLQRRQSMMQWSDTELERFAVGQNTRPPLWLRVQKPQQTDAVVREFSEAHFAVTTDRDAIAVSGSRAIYQTAAFQLGGVEIQDWASQCISRAVDAQPGERIWDACAGAGGKSLALASRMNNKGELIASDIRPKALAELERRAQRAGWFNIRTESGDLLENLPQAVAPGSMDRVLVDAPCTGAGTWRRNPDRRWWLSADRVDLFVRRQHELLTAASAAVRPGGWLVYATCSWLVEENEQLVLDWLSAQAHFRLDSQALVGFPERDADTMYYAVLRRLKTPID